MMDWNWEGKSVAGFRPFDTHESSLLNGLMMVMVDGDSTYCTDSVWYRLGDLEEEYEPGLRVDKRFPDLTPLPLAGLNASAILPQTFNSFASQLQRQESRLQWCIWNEEERGN